MIKLYKACNLTTLALDLAKDVKGSMMNSDAFAQDWIVVQNKETQHWLQSELSKLNGVSANIKFLYPSELAWQLIRLYHHDLPIDLPTDRIALHARIFDLLISNESELSKYGLSIPHDLNSKLHVAESISDVFDLYQMFRSGLLKQWTQHKVPIKNNEAWQCLIWQQLTKDLLTEFPDIPHRFEVNDLVHALLQSDPAPIPKQIFVFGLSHWSTSFFDCITTIGKHSDVHWYDQQLIPGDSLSSRYRAWSNPKLEVQHLFSNIHHVQIERTKTNDWALVSSKFHIHSCYTIEREVQVLKHELLRFLDEHKEYTVDDVLIMVPDFDQYAPIIKHVFEPAGVFPKIPVHIPEYSLDSSSDFLIQLINFFQTGEKITDFIELLNHPVVKQTFDISESEITFYSACFAKMNIHYGLSKHNSECSIEKGIHQLFLSFSMEKGNYDSIDDYILIDIRSNINSKSYITKLSQIHRIFCSFQKNLEGSLSLFDWVKRIHEYILQFFSEQKSMVGKLEKLIRQLSLSKCVTKVPFDIFQPWLVQQFNEVSAASTKMGMGVTVSTYIPYRNIPFRFVAMLGLNEGMFPRITHRPDFDLIHANPQPGDRSTKTDDTLLFFERIYSTKDHIHLSYIGEGKKGNMPSTLIQELNEIYPELQHQHHPLHGFNPTKDSSEVMYPSLETHLSQVFNTSYTEIDDPFKGTYHIPDLQEINLSSLSTFFSHPAKHLLNHVLRLKTVFGEDQPVDRALYDLTGLDAYHLKNYLIELYKHSTPLDKYKSYSLLNGSLPRGPIGQYQLNEQEANVQTVQQHVQEYLHTEENSYELACSLHGLNIFGTIKHLYGNEQVVWKINTIKDRDIIQLWINHLLLNINETESYTSKLIGFSGKKKVRHLRFDDVENPSEILNSYLELFTKKHPSKYHWSCIPSLAVKAIELKDHPEKKGKAFMNEWCSNEYSNKEDADVYNKLLWKNEQPWDNELFQHYAEIIWEPIVSHLKEE